MTTQQINFNGKNYTLTTEAVMTGRLLPYPKNYHEVKTGEEFEFEMVAQAADDKGVRYTVTWILSAIRGEEADNYDNYDFDNIYDVTPL